MTYKDLFPELRHWEVINYMIEKFGYKSYLEVGQSWGKCFKQIRCDFKESIDIVAGHNPTYTMPSDKFFATYPDKRYDIIFVDGDHEKTQVKRDIINSLNILNDGGTIICHDVNPTTAEHLQPNLCHNAWEAFAELRCERDDLEMYTIPVDLLGIIRRGSQIPYGNEWQPTWEYLSSHRHDLMAEIPVGTFLVVYDPA
jgi:hypothetical protein